MLALSRCMGSVMETVALRRKCVRDCLGLFEGLLRRVF
jgi:hypothetical protein